MDFCQDENTCESTNKDRHLYIERNKIEYEQASWDEKLAWLMHAEGGSLLCSRFLHNFVHAFIKHLLYSSC